ncbi:12538_t:CDS:2, partial [Acaulospora colombiana]
MRKWPSDHRPPHHSVGTAVGSEMIGTGGKAMPPSVTPQPRFQRNPNTAYSRYYTLKQYRYTR